MCKLVQSYAVARISVSDDKVLTSRLQGLKLQGFTGLNNLLYVTGGDLHLSIVDVAHYCLQGFGVYVFQVYFS